MCLDSLAFACTYGKKNCLTGEMYRGELSLGKVGPYLYSTYLLTRTDSHLYELSILTYFPCCTLPWQGGLPRWQEAGRRGRALLIPSQDCRAAVTLSVCASLVCGRGILRGTFSRNVGVGPELRRSSPPRIQAFCDVFTLHCGRKGCTAVARFVTSVATDLFISNGEWTQVPAQARLLRWLSARPLAPILRPPASCRPYSCLPPCTRAAERPLVPLALTLHLVRQPIKDRRRPQVRPTKLKNGAAETGAPSHPPRRASEPRTHAKQHPC